MFRTNATLDAVSDPPVAQAKRWVADRTFRDDHPLLDLSQAAPGYAPADELRSYLAELVMRPETSTYTPVLGLADVRAVVAADTARRFAGDVAADSVMITAGCNQAFCLAIGALCAPGDEVVLPTPWYFNHEMWLRANGIRPVPVHCDAAASMIPSVAAIAAAITPRTRAIVLVTPNNPCGGTYPAPFIEAVADIAKSADIALVLDETYETFRSTDEPAHALFARSDWSEVLVHLTSFSKSLSLPGYRVGALVAHADLLTKAARLADCQTIGAPHVGQLAVAFGLQHLGSWIDARRHEMLDRVDAFGAALDGLTGWEVLSRGAFFAYVRHPFPGESATSVCRRLADDHDLLTIPGECFGPDQTDCIRMAFGNVDAAAMPEIATRLAEASR